MGLFDRLRKKNDQAKASKPKKEENVLDLVKEDGNKSQPADGVKTEPKALKADTGKAHRILHHYHLSEKSNALSTDSRYVFRVARTTNKLEVKKAVERVYDVKVVSVNIINVSGKSRRYGRSVGRTQDWKKAVVTLKAGQKISGLAEGV